MKERPIESTLPSEIKEKAREYAKTIEHSYADTREELEEDVAEAWAKGFIFCLQGKVEAIYKDKEETIQKLTDENKKLKVDVAYYTDSCYGDKPLSPHWDFFQDGVEFGERESEKRIEELEKENAEQKLKLEALEGQTPWKDIKDKSEVVGQLTTAKEIIKILLHKLIKAKAPYKTDLTENEIAEIKNLCDSEVEK